MKNSKVVVGLHHEKSPDDAYSSVVIHRSFARFSSNFFFNSFSLLIKSQLPLSRLLVLAAAFVRVGCRPLCSAASFDDCELFLRDLNAEKLTLLFE